jgi:inward rectifier potassium channel
MARTRGAKPPDAAPYRIEVVGAERTPLRDLYHTFLRTTWPRAAGLIVATFIALNLVFAILYYWTNGVANVRHGSMFDAFSFSVQTLATIGYGNMYPQSHAAHIIVWFEALTGLLLTAVVTGLVFAKFSLSGARIVFSHEAVITKMDGVPTLMLRVGNARGNIVAEATARAVVIRTEKTAEGVTMYRMYDLPLVRERTAALTRSWTIMHTIGPNSLLAGYDAERFQKEEVEIGVAVYGTDDTSLQPVYARRTYYPHQILWGRRHVDVLSEREDGTMVLDLRRFHDHEESP